MMPIEDGNPQRNSIFRTKEPCDFHTLYTTRGYLVVSALLTREIHDKMDHLRDFLIEKVTSKPKG